MFYVKGGIRCVSAGIVSHPWPLLRSVCPSFGILCLVMSVCCSFATFNHENITEIMFTETVSLFYFNVTVVISVNNPFFL